MMNRIFLLIREQTRGNAELIKWMEENSEKSQRRQSFKIKFLAEKIFHFYQSG